MAPDQTATPTAGRPARGALRVYLGAAPGVGKTFAMLAEARRRRARGTDVVIGLVEPHGRRHTAEAAEGLDRVPTSSGVGGEPQLDVAAVLARRPEVVLVDELAHRNPPGARHAYRWQDVEELLAAGIDVVTTVNVQHLASLADVVATVTGVPEPWTVPDEVVRRAEQLELIDMAPEALRRRLAHGNIYPPERIDAELAHRFGEGSLTALRELALLWLADRVDDALARYRDEHDIDIAWPTRERIVVGLTGGPEGDTLIRRAARIAGRGAGGELLAVHVTGEGADGQPTGAATRAAALDRQRDLVESLGGTFHTVLGDDAAAALLEFARGANASQLVVGTSRRRWLRGLLRPGVAETVTRLAGPIDVHLVTHEQAGPRSGPRPDVIGRRRRLAGWLLAVLGPVLLTLALVPRRGALELSTPLVLFIAVAVGVALVGGLWPAVVGAVLGGLLLNWYLTPPYGTLAIANPQHAFAVVAFVLLAGTVASVADLGARRALRAARTARESEALIMLAAGVLRGEDSVEAMLGRVRETFGMAAVSLLEQNPDDPGDSDGWKLVAAAGEQPCASPASAQESVTVPPRFALALRGRQLAAADRRVLEAYAGQAVVVLDRERLRAQARQAAELQHGNQIRTALLAAVSHDLRTPLASVKAAVSSLRQHDVRFDPDDEAELLATIEGGADTLERLIANLLDVSRLQTGAVVPLLRAVALDEVVPRALAGLPPDRLRIEIAEDLPLVRTDPGLLERVVANVAQNALTHSGADAPVLLTASSRPGLVELRVVDCGRGVQGESKAAMFAPFQRLGDAPGGAGVGLGLAVARGFAEAVGGSIEAEDTPGGGLTMVIRLPAAAEGTDVEGTDPDRADVETAGELR